MMYYVVAEGRAKLLETVNVRDRSTYGIDWIVLYASSSSDAIRQWGLLKGGSHSRQAALEAEAARYRAAVAGYAPAWEAEQEVLDVEASVQLEALEAQQAVLDEAKARVRTLSDRLQTVAATPKRRVRKSAPPARARRGGPGPTRTPPSPPTKRRSKPRRKRAS